MVERHEVLRYGLVACLEEDRRLDVSVATVEELADRDVDIAVVSSELALSHRLPCPIIVYRGTGHARRDMTGDNEVVGALHHASLTIAQLHATVHAAVAGLRVNIPHGNGDPPQPIGSGDLLLIELIADGLSTREIAERMSYSERTIKKKITHLQERLGARSRAQIVARAIREGLI